MIISSIKLLHNKDLYILEAIDFSYIVIIEIKKDKPIQILQKFKSKFKFLKIELKKFLNTIVFKWIYDSIYFL